MKCIILTAGHATKLEAEIRADASGNFAHLSNKPKALLPGPDGRPVLDYWWEALTVGARAGPGQAIEPLFRLLSLPRNHQRRCTQIHPKTPMALPLPIIGTRAVCGLSPDMQHGSLFLPVIVGISASLQPTPLV